MKSLIVFALIMVVFGFSASNALAASKMRSSDLTYDLGVSSGSYGNGNYTEVSLGLNWYAEDWLAWRNAVFGRWQTDSDPAYGLDSSARFIAEFGDPRAGFTAFVGPGYRFASGTPTAPFAEAGAVAHIAGLVVGVGAKQVFDSWIHQGSGNDNQYFLILGGGGAL